VPDPSSWLLLEPGHPVVTQDGDELGRVEEVLGDTVAGIFDGLLVRRGPLGDTKYVPAELVESIDTERVHLSIAAEETERLDAIKPPGGVEADL
jgi:hypothetical protein